MTAAKGRSTAIVGATLIDGTGAKPLRDAVVLIEEDTIARVGPRSAVDLPSETEIVDAEGRFLLPGLIDAHVHVSAPEFTTTPPKGDPTAYATAIAIRNLRSALQAGVTTVRDVCGPRINLALRSARRNGQLVAPRLYTAGMGICMTGGHGSGFAGAAHEVDGPEAIRHAVRVEHKAGADLIKLLSSHRTDHPEFSLEEIEAGVDEAHRLGLPIAIHAANFVGTEMAARAGVDVIEHGSFLSEEAVDLMVAKGIVLVPTLWVKHDLAQRLAEYRKTPEKFPWGDAADLEESASWFRRCAERLPETIRLARERGVTIAAGTDFVLSDQPWCLLPEEIEHLVRHGLSPMEAIGAATHGGAVALGMADRLGTIDEGKWADLLLVDRDPVEDVCALKSVSWVMQAGKVIPRSREWDRRPIKAPIDL
jgi:imidazolonepropionase-like amidohydrolase